MQLVLSPMATLVLWASLFMFLLSDVGMALCPANGNTHAIYVTSNIGDNIWSFDTLGNYLGPVLNKASFPSGVQVDKLRAMRFGPEGHLYISSARGSYSRVFAVNGNGLLNHTMQINCTRNYLFTVMEQGKANPFLDHPYDITFHPVTEDMYVSNQNSGTVTWYKRNGSADSDPKGGASSRKTRFPAWKPSPNVKAAVEATENASSGVEAREIPTDIPNNAGLFASPWSSSYAMSSVRGLTMSPLLSRNLVEGGAPAGVFSVTNDSMMYYLLVCDVSGNMVHVFDPDSGTRLFGISVPSPIQVMFPSRYYSDSVSLSTSFSPDGTRTQRFEMPYMYVTSKDDGIAYMARFSARPSGPNSNGIQTNANGDDFIRAHRLYTINHPSPLHAASGIYENPSRDVLLIADRNGRRISSYASPFLTDFTSGYGPSPFLGFFVKQLPDQPEFITSALLEHQENIPFCYELNEDGKFRYVALCTAASIWSLVIGLFVVLVPSFVVYRNIQHCIFEHKRSQERLRFADSEADASRGSKKSSPMLGREVPNYGATE